MSTRMRWIPLLGAATLFLLGCEPNRAEPEPAAPAAERAAAEPAAQANRETDVAAIRELSRQWEEAGRGGNPDQMAAIYAEDAVSYSPGRDPIRGRAAIREDFASWFEGGAPQIDAEILDVEVAASGDLAYELGNYSVGEAGAGGERGRYLAVYRKIDGRWQIVREISNSSEPAEPATAQPDG